MKSVPAAALAALLSALAVFASTAPSPAKDSNVAANAQRFRAHSVNRPLNYNFPVTPRNHAFNARTHRHGWRHRHHRFAGLPLLTGPAVIYQNGEIGFENGGDITTSVPAAQPVVYRLGETGNCNVQQVRVPGSQGRTTVNIWRC